MAWNTLYTLLLYQSGGSLYNDSRTASALDSDKSIRAFKKSMEFYTAYGLPVTFDFANRFRSGDMPIGIVDYTTYNTLLVFAPEIKGQWAMSPVPGTVREDGTADHTSVVTPTGSIMLRGVRDREAAWTYMQWWNSSAVQSRYGIELETVLGASAKLAASTLAAVESLPVDGAGICSAENAVGQPDRHAGDPRQLLPQPDTRLCIQQRVFHGAGSRGDHGGKDQGAKRRICPQAAGV